MQNIFLKLFGGLRHRGIQVVVVVFTYLLIAESLPLVAHQTLYSISVTIKDLLVWMLPITICFFLAYTVASFKHRAPVFILAIVLFEAFSNLLSVWYAYCSAHIAVEYLPPVQLPVANYEFFPLWHLPFTKPAWWSSDKGSFIGILLGFVAALGNQQMVLKKISQGKNIAQTILTKVFSPLVPIFVLGFVARMHQTKLLHQVLSQYSLLLLALLFFLVFYITILFIIGSGKAFYTAFKNISPATTLAFTSGCSLSTMPWTIDGASKNLENPHFAESVIPATTNIQQIGDCIVNTFLSFLLYRHFFGHNPHFFVWFTFSLVFVLGRFATAAVLGGAIFVMLPIYETYLSFTPEMIAIIVAFNVVLDPLVTSCNVTANGALCRVFEKVWLSVFKPKVLSKSL